MASSFCVLLFCLLSAGGLPVSGRKEKSNMSSMPGTSMTSGAPWTVQYSPSGNSYAMSLGAFSFGCVGTYGIVRWINTLVSTVSTGQ